MASLFTVRPSGTEKTPFRVNLTAASLLLLKLRAGDLCKISVPHEPRLSGAAIAWESSSTGMKDAIVQTSKTLQELYGFKLGDKVNIERLSEKLQESGEVVLLCKNTLYEAERNTYSVIASATVHQQHDVLAPSQKLVIAVGSMKQEFEVVSVGGLLGKVTEHTRFLIDQPVNGYSPAALSLDFPTVGGLGAQLGQIRSIIEDFSDTEITRRWPNYRPVRGVLLYGAKGTGKSLLLSAIAASGWSNVIQWSPGTKFSAIQNSLLITIEMGGFVVSDGVTNEISALFAKTQNTQTLVVATVRHPNDVPERLRSEGCFEAAVELPIPDVDMRLDILVVMRAGAEEPSHAALASLANRTHGFVGADLMSLLKTIWVTARNRREHLSKSSSSEQPKPVIGDVFIIDADIEKALQIVRPSALQEIFLEKPNVRWSDIGGQHDLKERLRDAIELPMKFPDRLKSFGITPAKGVLLYGPPGCSKTLMVKALATETDFNFLVVKGAELISMYVGESERAIREVFRKARQASPSIIFFDEIDAIASRGKSGSDLNVLTTLLNEMDGFEELRNVMVIAATNKPESIDPAMMRPGRFDSVVYVGLPDFDTRKDIFDKRFAKISVTDEVRGSTADFAQRTNGLSGAEIVGICQSAGWLALKANREAMTADDISNAILQMPKGITLQMLKSYEEWNAQRAR